MTEADPLAAFSAPTRAWFTASFAAPTDAQAQAWAATVDGKHVLVSAPTGSGKTLAAFLAAIDRLVVTPRRHAGTRVLYVSPMKALAYDIDRNLRAPLVGITRAGERLGEPVAEVSVGMRTGDTPADERRRLARTPPDILITTPESLYLLLTSRARETLANVEVVICDEVHAVAGTKRGAHLALSLERLEALRAGAAAQRIGLSATQRPLDEVARFLGGGSVGEDGVWQARDVQVVESKAAPTLDVDIVVPVEDMSRLGELVDDPPAPSPAEVGEPLPVPTGPAAGSAEQRRSIWPAVHPRILDLVEAHRSTIVFANSRRLAERLCARLNELHRERLVERADAAGEPAAAGTVDRDGDVETAVIARAHHGSVARTERVAIEEALKSGQLRCVVATSSLELGIDMGAVDLVIQVESPGSVASGLQRIGRAGHQVGVPSKGTVFPKYRGDLVEAAVVVDRMRAGAIEQTRYPRQPLDVLAQQLVAMAAMDDWPVADLLERVRGAASFADLSREVLDGILDLLSGRYPSDEFAELRPRLNWDRVADTVSGRKGAQRLAVTSGGTIPDRGLYGVFLVDAGDGGGPRGGSRRVGELDEEMVYETRPGETIVLGASTWRIEDITRDQVLVTPAPGQPGKLPFWHGDAPGRPVEVGQAVGAFVREIGGASTEEAHGQLVERYGLDELAARNLVAYLAEQREATGALPTDTEIVVERCRDEIGDWRICVLSPFGGRVHAPWALAVQGRIRERLGMEVQTIYADDGFVIRLPEAEEPPPAELVLMDPDDLDDLVVGEVANSSLFAARFREAAARALLLPRRVGGSGPGGMQRTPLWQQRQRAADLLTVASRYGQFPVLLETYREVLRDVFDVPALTDLLRAIEARRLRVTDVETPQASPFAASLLFGYIAGYLYEGDAPLAERRAHALSLDRELLAELLGAEELRDLVDVDALDALEVELQRLADGRRARDADGVHDLLRELGDLRSDEVVARTEAAAPETVAGWLEGLEGQRRVYRLRIAGEERWAAAEDAARFRDGLGAPPVVGLPDAFLEPVDRPLIDLVARYARTHGPFHTSEVAGRLGLPVDACDLALKQLEAEGRVAVGEFRPTERVRGSGREWCDAEVLRRLRRRSLAALRRDVEPVEPGALPRFLPGWQGVAESSAGRVQRVAEVVEQLQGAPLVASTLERDVLAVRVRGYEPAWLDELAAAGDVVWVGRGAIGSTDGRLGLYLREQAPLLAPLPAAEACAGTVWWTPRHQALLDHLVGRGASFWPALQAAVLRADAGAGTEETLESLWDLVWAGLVTNDTLAPLRALAGHAAASRRRAGPRRRPGRAAARAGPPSAAGRWSLVAELTGTTDDDLVEVVGPAASATERAAALAAQLLDRYGVLTRAAVTSEDIAGGFSSVYGVLQAMEESGRARRGYFVEGLGGAQFALPGAVDRLRSVREPGKEPADPLVLAATDPANPYGAALAWPEPLAAGGHTPKRAAGAHIVLAGGTLLAYLERGSRSVLTFTSDQDELAATARALATLVTGRRLTQLRLQRIDGAEPTTQPFVAHLRAAGFVDHPRGLVLRD